jgi:F-type H+-transporting ATPase subunit b
MRSILAVAYRRIFLGAVFIWMTPEVVFAADRGWRPTYDVVMLWVNFLIFVFLLVKFLRAPLQAFFANRIDEIGEEIRRVEEKKKAAEEQVAQLRRDLAESDLRMEKMRERVVQQGKDAKEKIIEDAKARSAQLIKDARHRIDYMIIQAKVQFKAEMIDAAVDIATKQLPDQITAEDNQNFIDHYLETAT